MSASVLGHRSFRLYNAARISSQLASQMGVVVVGWQVYALTHSALDLGLIGLAQFIPTAVLTFAAGHTADRYDRRRIVQACQATLALAAGFLAWATFTGRLQAWEIFTVVAILGTTASFESPASAALLSAMAPEGQLARAAAISSGAFQAAAIAGPALGGVIYALAPSGPYALMSLLWMSAAVLNGLLRPQRASAPGRSPTLESLFAGVGFVWRNPAILGTISLDLAAVLLGGATALLPIFARDILHAGPWALGLLRAAPAVGALAMAAFLARRPIERRAGVRMFQAVIVFGLGTVVFALSRAVWLSLLALATLGAADMISVVIRNTLVQLGTPDEMRGRVGAVNFLFIGASNQLGGFESGVTAALFGAAPAALLGGLGTVAVALLWMRLFPSLRSVDRLEPHEEAEAARAAPEEVLEGA